MTIYKTLLLLLIVLGLIVKISNYKILGIYAFSGKSHFMMMNQLFKGLARSGHQMDVITPFSQKEKIANYTQLFQFPDQSEKVIDVLSFDVFKDFAQGRNISSVADIGYSLCEFVGMPEFINLARNPPNPPYDVVITQVFLAPCFMILGHLWKVPIVLVSTSALYPWMHDLVGNPENVIISPVGLSPISEGHGVLSRIYNAYLFYYTKFIMMQGVKKQNVLLKRYFGNDAPDIHELERSGSLILMNTYFPINGVKPLTTSVVEVGGLHIQNDGPEITKSLKKWLDESERGVVYFSLGSMLRIEMFPEETVKIIFESLAKLKPIRILMRIVQPEKLSVKIPDNFYTLPWMPQEKILQHPNVKLFITHGGLLGTQESIYYGVPMFCLPVFADQLTNTPNYVDKKVAVTANIMSLTREQFETALIKVLNDPQYKYNVKRLSKLFRDRPVSAMNTAIFWIEFVIRNGKDVLRSPVMNLTWWQMMLLDVLAILVICFFVIFLITLIVVRKIYKIFFYKENRKQKKN